MRGLSCFLSTTGGVSYSTNNTPTVFAFGESTSLKEGGKGAVLTCRAKTYLFMYGGSFPIRLFASSVALFGDTLDRKCTVFICRRSVKDCPSLSTASMPQVKKAMQKIFLSYFSIKCYNSRNITTTPGGFVCIIY